MKKKRTTTAISPTRDENYAEWYQEVVKQSGLAEHSPVRGCMIIKPLGMNLWENIKSHLNHKFKERKVKNVYFPLLIPLSFLETEAQHVQGFAKECAVVTHRRLSQNADGKLIPEAPLEEPLILRPTSETIIGEAFSRWVQSYRDLPLLINQWANVMRWEMRTRFFMRTSEFLWQEGHTVHETPKEAQSFSLSMLEMCKDFLETRLALPVIPAEHTQSEKFPGAENTYSMEALTQDNKALQMGTSHFLGQNFSKAQNIKFKSRAGKEEWAWTTSWGVSTRLIGGLIMTHSDDNGFVLPPAIAPTHILLIPILSSENSAVLEWISQVEKELKLITFQGLNLNVEVDHRDKGGGHKYWEAIKKGFPLILEIGSLEEKKKEITFTRRDRSVKKREKLSLSKFLDQVVFILEDIQKTLLKRAQKRLEESVYDISHRKDFLDFFHPSQDRKGLALSPIADSEDNGLLLKDLKVSFRGYPLKEEKSPKKCLLTGQKVERRVLVGASY